MEDFTVDNETERDVCNFFCKVCLPHTCMGEAYESDRVNNRWGFDVCFFKVVD